LTVQEWDGKLKPEEKYFLGPEVKLTMMMILTKTFGLLMEYASNLPYMSCVHAH
jgi:hypothetical protein